MADAAGLERALREAINEPELVADILEACLLTKVGLAQLAAWEPQVVVERLFLTECEAARLVAACKEATAHESVAVPAMSTMTEEFSMITADEEFAAAAEIRDASEAGAEVELTSSPPPAGTAVGGTAEVEEVNPTASELPEATPPVDSQSPQEPAEAKPVVASTSRRAPQAKKRLPNRPFSAPPTRAKPQPASTTDAPATPLSPRSSAVGADANFLRATASHVCRVTTLPPPQPEVTPAPTYRKPRALSGIKSRLFDPTAAFVAHVASVKEESKAVREEAEKQDSLRRSQCLKAVLSAPQGQRVTTPAPFCLASSLRPKAPPCPTTEELRMQEAQAAAFKPRPVPASLRESQRLDGFARSQIQHPAPTVPQPFQLRGDEKHKRYAEMLARRVAEEKKAQEEAANFKAMLVDITKILHSPPASPRKPSTSPTAVGVAPKLSTESRAERHAKVLDPARRARLTEAERATLEEAERKAAEVEAAAKAKVAKEAEEADRAKALMAMSLVDYRKTLNFKASPVPDFSAPFKPDQTKAAPITKAVGISLSTMERLGPRASASQGRDSGPRTNMSASACFTGTGSCGAFSSKNLRASTGAGRSGSAAARRRAGPAAIPELRGALELALDAAVASATSSKSCSRQDTSVEAPASEQAQAGEVLAV